MSLRRHAYFAHVALGYSATALVLVLTGAVFYLLPKVDALLSHADQMAQNGAAASQVVADSAKAEAKGILNATDAVNATVVKFNRIVIPGIQTTLNTTDVQLGRAGVLLNSLRAESDALKETTVAATGLTQEATTAIQTANGSIAAAQPLLEASTRTVSDLDAKVNDPKVTQLVGHLEGMSASGDKMLADAQWKAHQLLHPDKVKLGFWGSVNATFGWLHRYVIPPIF